MLSMKERALAALRYQRAAREYVDQVFKSKRIRAGWRWEWQDDIWAIHSAEPEMCLHPGQRKSKMPPLSPCVREPSVQHQVPG